MPGLHDTGLTGPANLHDQIGSKGADAGDADARLGRSIRRADACFTWSSANRIHVVSSVARSSYSRISSRATTSEQDQFSPAYLWTRRRGRTAKAIPLYHSVSRCVSYFTVRASSSRLTHHAHKGREFGRKLCVCHLAT